LPVPSEILLQKFEQRYRKGMMPSYCQQKCIKTANVPSTL
jgi:hypothetical protein